MKFWKFFASAKMSQVNKTLAEKLAAFDPDTMTAAGMLEMEAELDAMTRETAEANQEYQRELREAQTARANLNQQLSAAGILNEKLGTLEEGTAEFSQTSASLSKLLDVIDKLTPDVEREELEAVQAKETLEALQQASQVCADQLRTAKSEFDQAKRTLSKANANELKATKDAERAARIAGIRDSGSQLGTAMDAIKKAASQAEARADAARAKAQLLTKPEAEADPILQAALDAAAGKSPTPTDPRERFKQMKS